MPGVGERADHDVALRDAHRVARARGEPVPVPGTHQPLVVVGQAAVLRHVVRAGADRVRACGQWCGACCAGELRVDL